MHKYDSNDRLELQVVSQCPQTFSSLQFENKLKMQQQQFSEMEMPTQSSPNHSHHQSSSQNYHHHQQHQSAPQVSAGSSGAKRMSSQSTNISPSNSINPNGLSVIGSSSHCVSSSSSSPPPTSGSRHGYSTLHAPGSPTPAVAHCVTESNFNSSSCYNNNNNTGDMMAPGTSSHPGMHCSHLSSGQQLPVQSYLQGNELE